MDDLSVQGLEVKDEVRYDRNARGNVKERVYRFYLGTHGQFEERVPLEPFDDQEIGRRIEKLRAAIRAVR